MSATFLDANGIQRIAGTLIQTGTITAGTLPDTGAWVSGTAKANPVNREVTVYVVSVSDATNNLASTTIAVSPDGTTYTTIAVPAVAAAVNNLGAVTMAVAVNLPAGWYVKVTLVHTTVAASIYY